MKKHEMIKQIKATIDNEVSLKDIEAIVDAIPTVVIEALKHDKTDKVALNGLGTFKVKDVPERTGVIRLGEQAGEQYVVPAHSEICFKISKKVKNID